MEKQNRKRSQFFPSRAAVAPSILHRLFSDVEASASAIFEFLQCSYRSPDLSGSSNRPVWVSISNSLQKLKYCSTRFIDLLKYEAVNKANRLPLELWFEKAGYAAYGAEDILIDFEFLLDGGQVEAGGSAQIGQKRKFSEVTGSVISLALNAAHLTYFSDRLERVCSSFNSLLIEHSESFPFLREIDPRVLQYNRSEVTAEQAMIVRLVEWKSLFALLLQTNRGCSNTDIVVAPTGETAKGALTLFQGNRGFSSTDTALAPTGKTAKTALTLLQSNHGCSSTDTSVAPTGGGNTDKTTLNRSQSQGSNEHNLSLVCIVGASGVGKTVLIRSVYNNCTVSKAFDVRLWVCMSEKTNVISLLKEMIECITRQPCCICELHMLQEVLKEELTGKRFLLVLDGAENEEDSFWSSVVAFLEIGGEGSFVLVATSSRTVASATGTKNFFFLDPLSMKASWLVFLLFGVHPLIGFDLRQTCKQLVARCGGIPLCIKMLSGVLCCSDNETWVGAVFHNKLWEIDELGGAILPALRVCYDFLPFHLKHYLNYCSLFPKNFTFEKKHMVLLWISQCFTDPTVGIETEEVGIKYFDELLARSFFEKSPFHNDIEDKFVVHELIHFLVQHVSREEYFRYDNCLNSTSANVKHISINHGEFNTEQLGVVIKEVNDLYTFYVVNGPTSLWNSTLSPMNHLISLHDLLMKFKNLKTLNLSGTDIEELPISIQLLENLCYLGLNASKIKAFPMEICKLINLRTLEAKQCCRLIELPESITELSNLRHLDVSKKSGFVGMPCGIGHLTNLQTLSILNVGDVISQCSIGEIKNLENLRGRLQIAGLQNIGSGNDAKEANLITKRFLRSVTLHWNRDKRHFKCDESVAFQVFEGLFPSNNLEELIIRNYPGIKFPMWVEDSKFSKLGSVIIDNCVKIIRFPNLGELPSLRYLSVRNMYGVKNLGLTKRIGGKISPSFPSLELLKLQEMHGLEVLFEIEEGDFPCLRTLSISRCLMLESIPCFPSLLELTIHLCTHIPKVSHLPTLEYLKIEGFRKTRSLSLPYGLTGLKKLEINHCDELVSVEGLWWLDSIKDIKVIQCPKLVVDRRWEDQLIKKEPTCFNFLKRTTNKGQEISIVGELLDDCSSGMIHIPFHTAFGGEIYNSMLAKRRWKKACYVTTFLMGLLGYKCMARRQSRAAERRLAAQTVWQHRTSSDDIRKEICVHRPLSPVSILREQEMDTDTEINVSRLRVSSYTRRLQLYSIRPRRSKLSSMSVAAR